MERYKYVGPKIYEKYGDSEIIRVQVTSQSAVKDWCEKSKQRSNKAGVVTGTFIVNTKGELWVTDRGYEHVACARGEDVLSAGEISFLLEKTGIEICYLSNQSTGYCPDPSSWPAVQHALQQTDLVFPSSWSQPFVFRKCLSCLAIHIVKDNVFSCDNCGEVLHAFWDPIGRFVEKSMRRYNVFLEGKKIAAFELIPYDPSMGVAGGTLEFVEMEDPYSFFCKYTLEKGLSFNHLVEEDELIQTVCFETFKVFRENDGLEIQEHVGIYIEGMSGEGFNLYILGIPHPFYETLFVESDEEILPI